MVTPLQQGFTALSAPLVDEDRRITPAWQYLLQDLWNRTGSGAGISSAEVQTEAAGALSAASGAQSTANTAISAAGTAQGTATAAQGAANAALALASSALQGGNAVAGWVDPTGAGSRGTFDMNFAPVVSSPPTQAEVQAIVAQLVLVQKRLGQLELDLLHLGAIKH